MAGSVRSTRSRMSTRSRISPRSAVSGIGDNIRETSGQNEEEVPEGSGFKGCMTDMKITHFVEELRSKCWRCICNNTEAVLMGDGLLHQGSSLLHQIFALEECSCQEIVFFRGARRWCERRCEEAAIAPTPENKREALGDKALSLLRFPTMTLEQFQWEVVPSGILSYVDVSPVLQALSRLQRSIPKVGRFSNEARHRVNERARRLGATREDFDDHPRDDFDGTIIAYKACPDDPLDGMLATELWRSLVAGLAEQDDEAMQASEPSKAHDATTDVLTSGRAANIVHEQTGRSMVMGLNIISDNTAEARGAGANAVASAYTIGITGGRQRAQALSGGGEAKGRVTAHEFQRIRPGLYKFREDQLVELWLEDGEAFATNHGWRAGLAGFDPPANARSSEVRAALGLPARHPKGPGVPLAPFLTH